MAKRLLIAGLGFFMAACAPFRLAGYALFPDYPAAGRGELHLRGLAAPGGER